MPKLLLLLSLLFLVCIGHAQQGKKDTQKEKPPTQKEMKDMMKEMQKEMDNMSPEDKRVMDSMGIKMPSAATIPKMTDKQITEAYEQEGRVVPPKNTQKIASLPKKIFSATELAAYLKTTNTAV